MPESIREESSAPEMLQSRQSSRHWHAEENTRERLPDPEVNGGKPLFRHVPAWDSMPGPEPEPIRSRQSSRHWHADEDARESLPEPERNGGKPLFQHVPARDTILEPEPEPIQSRKSSRHETVRAASPEPETAWNRKSSQHESIRELSPEPEILSSRRRRSSRHETVRQEPEIVRSRQSSIHSALRPIVVHETSYVRTSTDRDRARDLSGRAVMLSPIIDDGFHDHHRAHDAWSVSDITDREREAEAAVAAEKHVQFKPDDIVDASEVAYKETLGEWAYEKPQSEVVW